MTPIVPPKAVRREQAAFLFSADGAANELLRNSCHATGYFRNLRAPQAMCAPDADAGQIFAMAERSRILVRNSVVSVADTKVTVTVLVGATILQPADTEDSLFRRVD